jgi:16S rRNA (uracil1498-N3)-methyltransferase
MQRYFVSKSIKDTLTIEDSNQFHHITRVMRMKPSDNVVVCDQDGHCFYMVITAIDNHSVTLKKQQALPRLNKKLHITLAQALIKKDHFELVLQKATELGADTIIPVDMDRSIVKLKDDQIIKKHTRWQSITQEASEQSQREKVCQIDDVMTLDCLDFSMYDHVFYAYEKEDTRSLKVALTEVASNSKIMMIIGPEGGFSEKEVAFLEGKATAVTLGPRILRSETAALYTLVALSFALEMSDPE